MAFLSMPLKIIDMIKDHLDEEAQRALIAVHPICVWWLQSSLYSHLTLQEDELSGRRVLATTKGDRCELVSTITYSPECSPVSFETRSVLQNLFRFPNLTQLSIIFDWGHGILSNPDMEAKMFGTVQTSIQAISKSRASFTGLRLQMYPPPGEDDWSDIFRTDPWRELLRGLKSFTLSVLRPATVDSSHRPGWGQPPSEFLYQFDSMFIEEMYALEDLHIIGPKHAFITELKWNPRGLERLKSITIENVSLDEAGVDYLADLVGGFRLRKICIRHCIAEPTTWDHLFDNLRLHARRVLTDVAIMHIPVHKALLGGSAEEWEEAQQKVLDEIGDDYQRCNTDRRIRKFAQGERLWDGSISFFDRDSAKLEALDQNEKKISQTWEKYCRATRKLQARLRG